LSEDSQSARKPLSSQSPQSTRAAQSPPSPPSPQSGRAASWPAPSPSATILLDAEDRRRRILQHALVLSGVVLLSIAGILFRRTHAALSVPGAGFALAAIVAFAAGYRMKVRWSVPYKGHAVVFENDPFRGEGLFIDRVLCGRGRMGIRNTLTGFIASGEGAGDRITADSEAGYLAFRCRIIAEPAAR
jgi:hypothetical protein